MHARHLQRVERPHRCGGQERQSHVAPDDPWGPGAVGRVLEGRLVGAEVVGHEARPSSAQQAVAGDDEGRPGPQAPHRGGGPVGDEEDVGRGHQQREGVDAHGREHLAYDQVEGAAQGRSHRQAPPRQHHQRGYGQLGEDRHERSHGHRHDRQQEAHGLQSHDAAEHHGAAAVARVVPVRIHLVQRGDQVQRDQERPHGVRRLRLPPAAARREGGQDGQTDCHVHEDMVALRTSEEENDQAHHHQLQCASNPVWHHHSQQAR
mmetsp:Transcript_102857/g.300079  ORF Transcript_102857/g.300079 Transcript_102857/m.300079 type:complete len:262 (+) Transcript_102857:730-1515(+)